MSKNKFRGPDYEEHSIEDETGKLVGHLRIKPSGILWKKPDGKKFYGVRLEKFIDWIVNNGQTKVQ